MAAPPDCLRCGTCCFSTLETYVRVRGDDLARLGAAAAGLVSFDGHRAHMRMADGRCAALRIDAAEGRFFCTVYEDRPQLCRDLGRGSPECLGELASKGERPPAALKGQLAVAALARSYLKSLAATGYFERPHDACDGVWLAVHPACRDGASWAAVRQALAEEGLVEERWLPPAEQRRRGLHPKDTLDAWWFELTAAGRAALADPPPGA